jgi:hypothetical protein
MHMAPWKLLGGWARRSVELAKKLRRPPSDHSGSAVIVIEAAPGEVIDKITILEIKSERISDPDKLSNVRRELDALRAVRNRSIAPSETLTALAAELRRANEVIWDVEDEIRRCERASDFGPRFVKLARAVYKKNDERAAIKRKINDLLRSRIIEEKSYDGNPGE